MKKKLLGFIAVSCLGLFACNDDSTTSTTTDSTSVTAGTTDGSGSVTTTTDYAAMADEFERNSAANRYMDARTGKPIKINVDRTTGTKTNATTNEPVTRYIMVDNNDWWAYDAEGTRLGKARYENNKVMYEGDNGKWVDYDVKWKDDKIKTDDMKIKTDEDGSIKIKTDDKKIKIDENGKTKVDDN